MRRRLDTQKSACYAWEREAARTIKGGSVGGAVLDKAAAEALADRIWRAERARFGHGRKKCPTVEFHHSNGMAWGNAIMLGTRSRTPWVTAHEIAHCLLWNIDRGNAHGPAFVGTLIGIVAREFGYDATLLMAMADERGLKYDYRRIGHVPVKATAGHERLLELLPCRVMQAAVELDCSYRVVQGHALTLIRRRLARYYRGRLVRIANTTAEAA